jgi:hypothetical protein
MAGKQNRRTGMEGTSATMTDEERNPVNKQFKSIRPNCLRSGKVGLCFNWEKAGQPERDFLWVKFDDGGHQLRRRNEYEPV